MEVRITMYGDVPYLRTEELRIDPRSRDADLDVAILSFMEGLERKMRGMTCYRPVMGNGKRVRFGPTLRDWHARLSFGPQAHVDTKGEIGSLVEVDPNRYEIRRGSYVYVVVQMTGTGRPSVYDGIKFRVAGGDWGPNGPMGRVEVYDTHSRSRIIRMEANLLTGEGVLPLLTAFGDSLTRSCPENEAARPETTMTTRERRRR